MSLTPGYSPPEAFDLRALRRRTQGLLLVGAAQLLTWLGFAVQDWYWGRQTIGLLVHAYLPVPPGTPPLTRFIASAVGLYATGSTGRLLYHASSLLDYLLYYSIADFGFLDALFVFGACLYLHQAVRRLRRGRELSAGISQVFARLGLASVSMFVAKMLFNSAIMMAFATQTQHQFDLADRSSSLVYVLLGSMLSLCAPFVQLGSELQQDAELTIWMAIIVELDVMLARRKMSLTELSERVGITLANLSVLKSGKAKAVRFSTLAEICRVLDCQPGDLLAYAPDAP